MSFAITHLRVQQRPSPYTTEREPVGEIAQNQPEAPKLVSLSPSLRQEKNYKKQSVPHRSNQTPDCSLENRTPATPWRAALRSGRGR